MDEYDKKFAEMQKYIPFLEAMIDRLQKVTDSSRVLQLQKMQQLHGILTSKKRKYVDISIAQSLIYYNTNFLLIFLNKFIFLWKLHFIITSVCRYRVNETLMNVQTIYTINYLNKAVNIWISEVFKIILYILFKSQDFSIKLLKL